MINLASLSPHLQEQILALLKEQGMSLRDYFATHAPSVPSWYKNGDDDFEVLINWRWSYADQMLKGKEK